MILNIKLNNLSFYSSQINQLHSEKNGQALIFVIIVLFTLVCFLTLTINVGHRVSTKINVQNASDSGAIAGGIWMARGLNMMSLLNVSMTEIFAVIVLMEAIVKGNKLLPTIHKATVVVAGLTCFLSPGLCFKWLKRLLNKKYRDTIYEKYPKLTERVKSFIKILWKILHYVEVAEDIVAETAYLAPLEANSFAQKNIQHKENENITTYPVFLFLNKLPVDKGEFEDLCPRTAEEKIENYNYHHYSKFLDWDGGALSMELIDNVLKVKTALSFLWTIYPLPSSPDLGPLVPPIGILYYWLLVDLAYDSFCGEPETVIIDTYTSKIEECKKQNGSDIEWFYKLVEVTSNDCKNHEESKNSEGKINIYHQYSEKKDSIDDLPFDKNDFTPVKKGDKEVSYCKMRGKEFEPGAGGQREVFKKEEWMLKCKIKKEEKGIDVTYPDDSSGINYSKTRPKPYMIKEDFLRKPCYLMVVNKGTGYKSFVNKNGQTKDYTWKLGQHNVAYHGEEYDTWTYSQIKIYNASGPEGADLFNQNWRVTLVPFDATTLSTNILPEGVGQNILDKFSENEIFKAISEGASEVFLH